MGQSHLVASISAQAILAGTAPALPRPATPPPATAEQKAAAAAAAAAGDDENEDVEMVGVDVPADAMQLGASLHVAMRPPAFSVGTRTNLLGTQVIATPTTAIQPQPTPSTPVQQSTSLQTFQHLLHHLSLVAV